MATIDESQSKTANDGEYISSNDHENESVSEEDDSRPASELEVKSTKDVREQYDESENEELDGELKRKLYHSPSGDNLFFDSATEDNEVFKYQLEIINPQAGSRKMEWVWSTAFWPGLQKRISEILNVFTSSFHAQYRLSTDNKTDLPFNLTSQSDLDVLHDMLRPLIVSPRLVNGKRSTRKMKEVKVHVFNKLDVALVNGKVSNICPHTDK